MNEKFPQTHPHQKTGGLFNVYCVYIIIMYVYVYNNYVCACKCQWAHDYVFVFFVYFIRVLCCGRVMKKYCLRIGRRALIVM